MAIEHWAKGLQLRIAFDDRNACIRYIYVIFEAYVRGMRILCNVRMRTELWHQYQTYRRRLYRQQKYSFCYPRVLYNA